MAKAATEDLSVNELEKLLENKKSLLDNLAKKRERLQRDLDAVELEITALEGGRGTRGAAAARRTRMVRRPKNEKSLHATVLEILGKSKKGFALSPLCEKVLETGYKTNSTNFKNVLYQCLYNSKHIEHDETSGHYKIKS